MVVSANAITSARGSRNVDVLLPHSLYELHARVNGRHSSHVHVVVLGSLGGSQLVAVDVLEYVYISTQARDGIFHTNHFQAHTLGNSTLLSSLSISSSSTTESRPRMMRVPSSGKHSGPGPYSPTAAVLCNGNVYYHDALLSISSSLASIVALDQGLKWLAKLAAPTRSTAIGNYHGQGPSYA